MKTVGVLSTRKLGNGALGCSLGFPVCVETAGKVVERYSCVDW